MPRKVKSKKSFSSRSKPRYSRKRVSNQKRRSKLRKNTRKKSRAHTPVKRRTNTYRRDSQKGGGEFELAEDFMDGVGRRASTGIDVGGLHIPDELLLLAASYATYRGINALPALASATRRQWERFKAYITADAPEEEVQAAAMRLFGGEDPPPADQAALRPARPLNARVAAAMAAGEAGLRAARAETAAAPRPAPDPMAAATRAYGEAAARNAAARGEYARHPRAPWPNARVQATMDGRVAAGTIVGTESAQGRRRSARQAMARDAAAPPIQVVDAGWPDAADDFAIL